MPEATSGTRRQTGFGDQTGTTRDVLFPEKQKKRAIPVWVYVLGAGMGGLMILLLCVGVAWASGMFGSPTQAAQVEPSFPTDVVAANTQSLIPPSPTAILILPTDLPPLAPDNTPAPTNTTAPLPTPRPGNEPSGKIVYACQVSGKSDFNEICLINADGSGFRQLTSNGADNGWPSLSPDGQTVFYASTESGSWQIYKISLSSNSNSQVTFGPGMATAPDMSPNGQIVYTQSSTVDSIWVMNANGSGAHQVYKIGWAPVWSPDGRKILFASGSLDQPQLYIINADGSDFHQLTNSANLRGRSDWSSLDLIAFYAGPSWSRNLFTINSDGSGLSQITDGGNSQGPSFSPDGQWIAFTGYFDNMGDSNGCEIYIIRIDGSDRIRLTSNSYCDWQPRWGP